MSNQEFKEAITLLIGEAPKDWLALQIRYQYFDGAMKIETYFKNLENAKWCYFYFEGFDLMDFFDEYRKKTHPKLDEPWSELTLFVDKNLATEVEYKYGDPNVLGS